MKNKNLRSRRNLRKCNVGADKISDVASGVMNFANNAFNSFKKPDVETPLSYTTNGPISYERQNYADSKAALKKLRGENVGNTLGSMGSGASMGASLGSIIPGVGTVIGGAVGAVGGLFTGLFGGAKRKRELRKQLRKTNEQVDRNNKFNQADSFSDFLNNEYLSNYGDTQDDVLYNKGKSPLNSGKSANALVGKGETIIDGNSLTTTEVSGGSGVGVDDVPAVVNPEDAVMGNLTNPRTGNTFAEDMKPITRMEKKLNRNKDRNTSIIARNTDKLVKAFSDPYKALLMSEQANVHNKEKDRLKGSKMAYWDGKSAIPTEEYDPVIRSVGYNIPQQIDQIQIPDNYTSQFTKTPSNARGNIGNIMSTIGNTLTDTAPIMYNLLQGNKSADNVNYNSLTSTNRYSGAIQSLMAGRKYNVKPEIKAIEDAERRSRYNARQLGSEAGINRYMDVASTANLMNMMSSIYGKKQQADNQYAAENANVLNALGEREALSNTQAKQLAYDWNQKHKGAKQAFTAAGLSQLSNWNQNRRKTNNQVDYMNKIFSLYYKNNK